MKEINYRNMFVLGVILSPIVAIGGLFPLSLLGIALVLIALANRSRWEE